MVTETVMLRTGAVVHARAAQAIWLNIQAVWLLEPGALAEAARIARDARYQASGDAGVTLLKRYALLDADGRMRNIDREVVLAATEGDGVDLVMRPPWPDD